VNKDPSQEQTTSSETNQKETKGVKTLLGDPKKAIITLSIPMIVALTVTTLYTVVNGIWVSGLGADALAAVGFVFPFFFMAQALATGIGIGGGSAVSRKIGAKNKEAADNVATHTLLIMVVIAIIFTVIFYLSAASLFTALGAGAITPVAASYARIIFLGSILIFFSVISNTLLRSEGDAKRSMIALLIGAILNAILDPIFIYVLGLGVDGAAWATLVSLSVSIAFPIYWMFIKKDTYLCFTWRHFHFNKNILKEIFSVGIPASLQQLSISIMMVLMNGIIVLIEQGSTNGIAVFSAGWRIATIASMPLLGIATAVIAVLGAAYGARDYEKLNIAYMYSIRIGIMIEAVIAVATFLLAPIITLAFIQSETGDLIANDITVFLQIVCFYYPTVALGIISSSVFQAIDKGFNSLVITIFRTIVLIPPLAYLFSIVLGWGLPGAWWGLVISNILGSCIGFIWAKHYINKIRIHPLPAPG
jgi:putative MATE family efflux protein